MKIDDVQIGVTYVRKYDDTPLLVREIVTEPQTRGYSWNRTTVNVRRVRVERPNGDSMIIEARHLDCTLEARQRSKAAAQAERERLRELRSAVWARLIDLGLPASITVDTTRGGHVIVNIPASAAAKLAADAPEAR